ncbi:MAG: response regulator transcription factor [Opitutales bacterium]|nr:response regulator transcription factor [Opitutales bacterium]MDG2169703.1 response regulator transcription factor [Opitutales bacterium]
MNNEGPKKILIVEDHPILVYGLQLMIEKEEGFNVSGVVKTKDEALDLLGTMGPDLVVIDISLQYQDGLTLIKQVKESEYNVPILCLSMHEELYYAEQCLRAGANGFITKSEPCEVIISGIEKILGGEIYLSESIRRQMLKQMGHGPSPWLNAAESILSNKEILVFKCIGQGLNNREIAKKLTLSIKTVEAHRYRIKKKLNLKNSIELIRIAIRTTSGEAAIL